MILEFFQWLQSTDFGTALRESTLAYPIIMSLHLSGMALFGGMILMTDMRLLGLALRKYSISDVVSGLRPWKRAGFALTVGCGILLAWSKAGEYYGNPFFWSKLTLLALVGVHAFIFRPRVYNRAEELDRAPVIPTAAKVAACLSIVLWVGLVSMGRLIGYYEPAKNTGQPAARWQRPAHGTVQVSALSRPN